MKNNQLILFLVSLLFCFSSFGGQEGHGGNGTALEFVKIGQAIKSSLEKHPDWKISQIVSPAHLSWSINNTFVTTGISRAFGVPTVIGLDHPIIFAPNQLSAHDEQGDIFVHTPAWQELNCDEKIKEVLHQYLEEFNYDVLFAKKYDDTNYEISSLFPAGLNQGRRCNDFLHERGPHDSGDFSDLPIPEQVRVLRYDIVEFIYSHPNWVGSKVVGAVPFRIFKDLIMDDRHTNILLDADLKKYWGTGTLPAWVKEKDIVTLASNQDYLREQAHPWSWIFLPDQERLTRAREVQLGAQCLSNDAGGSGIYIWINQKSWATFTHDQKFELIFHEYLSLLTTLDLYFRISSTIFLEK